MDESRGFGLRNLRTITGASISGVGDYRPVRVVDNDEIATRVPVTAEWIRSRSGVVTRRHASDDETTPMMSAKAAIAALADAGLQPDDIDLVILATGTPRRPMPGLAPETASIIGCDGAGAFDVNAACAGFAYAVSIAADSVRGGSARHVLVIGADRLTDWVDPAVPDTFAILGDGAGAVVVSRSDEENIGPAVWGSDGSRHAYIEIPESTPIVQMQGPLVYKWAVSTMPDVSRAACKAAGVELDEVAYLVFHQANSRILETIAKDLGFPADRVACDVVQSGNTSAASIPLALADLRVNGRARNGELVLLAGFGAGLTYSAQIVRMP